MDRTSMRWSLTLTAHGHAHTVCTALHGAPSKTYTYHFEDVFAPVFAKDQDYNINSMIEGLDNFNINDITYTQEEMEDHDPTVLNKQKSEFKHL